MILLILISCLIHKTTLTGVVDYTGDQSCTIILENSDMIIINSNICKQIKEGDTVKFYARKK
tara:strand:+ start:1302 stop:1487 length:186 start_codon:yes stop_codon:yes gene_type:complete